MLEWFSVIISSLILEDPTTLAVAAFVQEGKMSWMYGGTALFVGITLGDALLYGLGVLIHQGVLKSGKYKFLNQPVSGAYIFAARFVPGMRVLVYTTTGVFKYPFIKFLVINALSCLIWSVALILVGAQIYEYTGWYGIVAIVALFIGWTAFSKWRAARRLERSDGFPQLS